MSKSKWLLALSIPIILSLFLIWPELQTSMADSQINSAGIAGQANKTTSFARGSQDDPSGVFVISYKNGKSMCRQATSQEVRTLLRTDASLPRHIISHPELASGRRPLSLQSQTGLQIVLRGTDQLENFPQAKAGFLRAAARWEKLIQSPITIILDVDFGPTRFGVEFPPDVLGSTSTQSLTNTNGYSDLRNRLLTNAGNSPDAALIGSLPTGTVPTDIGSTSATTATSANLRALGILNPVADPTTETDIGDPPAIGFNSNFHFDFEPDDGFSDTGFDSVATHEIGHALGFISRVGNKELNPSATNSLSTWDLFRFRPGVTSGTFATASRILSSGGDQVFFDGASQSALSTGRPDGSGGDGNQSSHWKDDDFGGPFLGVLDPTIGPGQRYLITDNDLRVLSLIGYQMSVPGSDGLTELSVDDGSAEVDGFSPGTNPILPVGLNRLTPTQYPSTLRKIRFFIRQVPGQPSPAGAVVQVLAYNSVVRDPQSGNFPLPLVNQTVAIPDVGTTGQFIDLDLPSGPTINSGDWYVGYSIPNQNIGVTFAGDSNGVQQNRGFTAAGLPNLAPFPIMRTLSGSSVPANLMIRAVVSSTACSVVLKDLLQFVTSVDGQGSVNVAAPAGCQWSAVSTSPWLTTNSSGVGNGIINYTASINYSPPRIGSIVVGEHGLEIIQDAPLQIFSKTQIAGSGAAGPGQCSVSSDQYTIPISATATQLTLQWGGSDQTSVYVRFGQPVSGQPPNLVADTHIDKAGTIVINTTTSPAIQAGTYYAMVVNCDTQSAFSTIAGTVFGQTCPYSISGSDGNFSASGGPGSFTVNTLTGCAWSAQGFGGVPVQIGTGNFTSDGPGQLAFSVFPNLGISKTGFIRITGLTHALGDAAPTIDFPLSQSSGCSLSLQANSITIPAGGGSGAAFLEASDSSCPWTVANNNPDFITLTFVSPPPGSGSVHFDIPPNSGSKRSGTLVIGGLTFTVNQDSNCTFSLGQTSKQFSADGGTDTVNVTSTSGCQWTATSNNSFITINSGSSGSGNGQVSYTASANPTGASRTGTITVAGQTFTVNQDGDCGFAIDSNSQSFTASGGPGTINVTSNGCHWTAVSNNPDFITIISGSSDDGNGQVGFTVAANIGPARSGTMTIAGKTFTVTQGNGCTYELDKNGQSFSSDGGTDSVNITASPGCTWTSTTNSSFVTVTSGASGSGPGAVNYNVATNVGAPRSSAITIAGQQFTVSQDAPPCFTTVTPNLHLIQPIGESIALQVNAPQGCGYTVSTTSGFISITGGETGNGPGSLNFDVSENTSADPRAGSISVAGVTLVVTQLGTSGVVYGDLNGDGNVTVADLVILANVIAGNIQLADTRAADVKFDHSIDISDLVTLANELAGNISYVPVVPITGSSIVDPATGDSSQTINSEIRFSLPFRRTWIQETPTWKWDKPIEQKAR